MLATWRLTEPCCLFTNPATSLLVRLISTIVLTNIHPLGSAGAKFQDIDKHFIDRLEHETYLEHYNRIGGLIANSTTRSRFFAGLGLRLLYGCLILKAVHLPPEARAISALR